MKLRFCQKLPQRFVQTCVNGIYVCLILLGNIIGYNAVAQTTLSFTPIPYTDPDIISPGRGAEQWEDGRFAINYPLKDLLKPSLNVYHRFTWNQFEPTQGSYTWKDFDQFMRNAINKGQKLSFGIMTCFPDGAGRIGIVEYDNGNAAYPEYLHRLMQSDVSKDWKTNGIGATTGYGTWVPNWNSPYYLARLKALHEALNDHIINTSYQATDGPHKGKLIAYKNVINSIDIRGYGSWGEWHSHRIINAMTSYPAGSRATAATLKTIVDHHVNVFQDFPLSMMISSFDAEMLPNTQIPKEVTAYILSRSNKWGKLGWRRDNWGDVDSYLDRYLRGNTQSFGTSGPFNAIILERWKYAPVSGETPGWMPSLSGICAFDDLERQIREYHASVLSNGNFGTTNPSDCVGENIRSTFKATGYRLVLEGGSISAVTAGKSFVLKLQWKNIGIAPTYETWNAVIQLKNSSKVVVWSDTSQFKPKLFLPQSQATSITDNFVLPANIAPGNYDLSIVIKDPSGYRAPLPLAIQGRNADGSYSLKNIVVNTDTGGTPETPCSLTNAAIFNTQSCEGQTFHVILSSADGVAPYDLVINGTTYNDIHVGDTIITVTDSVTNSNPPVATSESIWNIIPVYKNSEDDPVELGVKFKSSVNGFANGVRFFSPENAAGIYTGHLWSDSGQLLAAAIFKNVTAGAWQEVLFNAPVPIVAGKVYVVSYYTSAGRYAGTAQGLPTAFSNGRHLTALTGSGGGGVYKYGGPGMPSSSFNATNYWADIVFTPATATSNAVTDSVYTFSLQSVTDSSGCVINNVQSLTVSPANCLDESQSVANRSGASAVTIQSAGIENAEEKKSFNKLEQNYPNPFHDNTIISYSLAEPSQINLSLFDMNGRMVKLIAAGFKEAGKHTVRCNAAALRSGIYFYRLSTGKFSEVKKMVIQ